MDRVLPTVTPAATVTDGFGRRINGIDSETGDEVELLEFAPDIVEHSGFVTALAERVARFASVRHASYVHMRRLDRPSADRLQLVSDLTQGWRLSEMLEESAAAKIPIDITVVIALLRQLLPAVALFGRHNRDAAMGAISAHRLIVTPQSRLVIVEHAFGPAIEKLNLGRDKLWRDFQVAMPPSTGLPRANQRADAMGVGVVALTLLLGRSLEVDEFPSQLQELVDSAQEYRDGQAAPLSSAFSNWLKRALQFDVANAFQTPSEAQVSFESVLASDRSYVTTSPAFIEWVSRVGITIEDKRPPKPAKAEPPAAPEREAQPAPVENLLVGSSGAPLQQVPAFAREQSAELRRDRPQPEPEPEPVSVPQPVLVVEPEPEAVEEVNLLEEMDREIAAVATSAREPEPEPKPERESAYAREKSDELRRDRPAAEPEPVPEPPRAQPRIEDDPIALQLLTYKPKNFVEPSVREPEPEPEPEPVEEPQEEVAQEAVQAEPQAEPQAKVQEEEALRYEPPPPPEPVYEQPPAPKPRLYTPPPPPPPLEPVTKYEEPATYDPVEEPAPAPAPAAAYAPVPPVVAPPAAVAPVAFDEPAPSKGLLGNPLVLGLAGVVLVLLAVMGWLLTRPTGDGGMREGEGELVVQSRPEGAQVKIDGEVKGNTPLTVRLDSGAHVLEVQSGKSEPRVIPLMIQAGVQTSQYVELQGVAKTGALEIRSEPAGARVTIDGRPRGTTPVTVRDLSPGDHTVVLEAGGRKVQQAVKIEAGGTAQLVVPMTRR